jgi:PAS domain S-box-containing protein
MKRKLTKSKPVSATTAASAAGGRSRPAEGKARSSLGTITLDDVLPGIDGFVFLLDESGRISDFRSGATGETFVPPDAFLGRAMAEVLPPEAAERLDRARRAATAGEPTTVEYSLPFPDGRRDFESRMVKLAGGRCLCIVNHVTRRARAEEAQHVQAERLRQTVRVSQIGIFDHDHRSDTIYWSPEQRRNYGWELDEPVTLEGFIGQVYPEDRERIGLAVARAHDPSGNGLFDVEHRITRRDGAVRWLSTRSQTLFEGEGSERRAVRTIGGVADITERKELDLRLQASEEQLRLALSAAQLGVFDLDLRTRRATVNRQYVEMLGYDPATVEDSEAAAWERLHPDDRAMVRNAFDAYLRGEAASYQVESRQRSASGEWKWISTVGQIVERDAEGRPVRMLGIHTDVTARRHAEELLRESEARLNAFFLQSPVAMAISDMEGRYTHINPTLAALNAKSREEHLGRRPSELFPVEMAGPIEAMMRRVRETGEADLNREMTLRTPDRPDELRHVLYSSFPIVSADGRVGGIGRVLMETTELKHAEAALRMKDEAIATSINAIAMTDESGRITYVNDAFRRLWGYDSVEEILGRLPTEFADEQSTGAILATLARDGAWQGELVGRRKDGSAFDLLLSASTVRDARGKMLSMMASFLDVTERRRAEARIRSLNEELEERVRARTAELEAANRDLEAFTYSVSHDLRAPLRAMSGYSNLLVEDYGAVLGTDGERMCNVVRSEAARMGRLIDDLLAFSKLGRVGMQRMPVDMRRLAESVADELVTEDERGRIDVRVAPLPAAMGDPNLLRQVLVNLLSNAIKFSSLRGRAVIEVTGRADGAELIYAVRDNGAGFDMDFADKLYGVFQRLHTEDEFPGTGVGLAIVQRIVHRHGGRVWAAGVVDEGATFFFSLPAARSPE